MSGKIEEALPPLCRLKDLEAILPFKRATIWLRVSRGSFPKPFKLSRNCMVWRRDEILAWLEKVGTDADA